MPDDYTLDTEWNDALRAHKIIPEKEEKTFTQDDIEALVESVAKQHAGKVAVEDATLEELEELEDLEDDRTVELYRRKRLAEMKALAERARFGDWVDVSKPEYAAEVTAAAQQHPVVLNMYKSGIELSALVTALLGQLARRNPVTKFCRIVADQCIENYPDRNVPTVIVYVNGGVRAQLLPADFERLGGESLTVGVLQRELERLGAIGEAVTGTSAGVSAPRRVASGSDDEDDDGDSRRPRIRTIRGLRGVRSRGGDSDDD